MNKVLITNIAKSDILNIKEYISAQNPIASNDFISILTEVFEMLSKYPNAGVKKLGIKNQNVQIYTIKKKYNIIYQEIDMPQTNLIEAIQQFLPTFHPETFLKIPTLFLQFCQYIHY